MISSIKAWNKTQTTKSWKVEDITKMEKLTETTLFSEVVENAIRSVHLTSLSERRRDRWVSSIIQAAAYLNTQDLDGVEYDMKTNRLRITEATEGIIECGTTCECIEFENGVPCRHVAAVRLLKRYFEKKAAGEEIVAVMPMDFQSSEILECSNAECGWKGTEKQLVMLSTDEPQPGVCPKCESEVEDVTPAVKRVRAARIMHQINGKYASSRKMFAGAAS